MSTVLILRKKSTNSTWFLIQAIKNGVFPSVSVISTTRNNVICRILNTHTQAIHETIHFSSNWIESNIESKQIEFSAFLFFFISNEWDWSLCLRKERDEKPNLAPCWSSNWTMERCPFHVAAKRGVHPNFFSLISTFAPKSSNLWTTSTKRSTIVYYYG